ncbi:hypothetical protein [Streptomyces sp. NPDC058989]|uniref:hypothetical protein n=1 Tax=Streptomyces sp. NPDC058989 TaxID=3346686 RepID=UPI00369172C7
MADDRYNWLDKDAAEHLLRGEPVGARHGDGARELEQLLQAAAAVGAKTSGAAPLPGEEAAVTAFRQAAAGSRGRAAGPSTALRGARATGVAERPWVVRPFRRGFVVALAACAIGGVAVAAGTGVLHSPFRSSDDPEPASTVSAVDTPGPFDTREPGAQTDGTTERTPDPSSGGKTAGPDGSPTPGSSRGATPGPGKGTPGDRGHGQEPGGDDTGGSGSGSKKKLLLSLCRDYESGKNRQMDRETVQRLESKAGGPEKVHAFCRAYLDRYHSGGGSGDNDGFGGGSASGGSGDEDDDDHPSSSPTTPAPGASTPAPGASSSAVQPRSATPSATATR